MSSDILEEDYRPVSPVYEPFPGEEVLDYEPEYLEEETPQESFTEATPIPVIEEPQVQPKPRPILERLKPKPVKDFKESRFFVKNFPGNQESSKDSETTIQYGKHQFTVEQHNSYTQRKLINLFEKAVLEKFEPHLVEAIAKVTSNFSQIKVQTRETSRHSNTQKSGRFPKYEHISPSRRAFLKRLEEKKKKI